MTSRWIALAVFTIATAAAVFVLAESKTDAEWHGSFFFVI